MFKLKQYDFKNYNFSLIIAVLLLSSIGAYLIQIVQKEGENLFTKQILGIVMGIIIIAMVSLIDYHFISQFYIVLYVINMILLIAVKVIGIELNYSKRWLDLGFFNFQPSELSKLILIIVLAKIFVLSKDKMNKFYIVLISGVVMAIPTLLILTQTDLSTSMVIMFIFVVMIFVAGLSYKIILPILIIGIPVLFGLFWYIQQDYQVILTEYQQTRVLSILNSDLEQYSSTMYQQNNSTQVIGSGKLTGKLILEGVESLQSDTFVPISESDFIFAVVGEALGFIGGCAVLGIFAFIIFQCLITANQASDLLGKLTATGIASMFMFQVFVNIGVATALLPNTGLPLPFVSYGLSSLICSMLAIGMIINIGLQKNMKWR